MTESLVPDRITPSAPPDLYVCLGDAWRQTSQDSAPTRASLLVLLSHWALETGFGHGCHCFNLGNKKHVPNDGHNYTQFACGEELPLSAAQMASASDPAHVQIVRQYQLNGRDMASVRFLPPHPATSFVAFDSLAAGALDYLVGLRGRFRSAWPAVVAGDVAQFCHLLKLASYYTADEHQYTTGVLRCYHQLDAAIPPDPSDSPGGESGSAAGDPEDPLPHYNPTDTKTDPVTPPERETAPELPGDGEPPEAA